MHLLDFIAYPYSEVYICQIPDIYIGEAYELEG